MNSQDKLQELVLNGDFEAISKIFEKNEKRLDKILRQSDNQQASILKLNAELEDYKNNLEIKVVEETSKRVEQEKLLMQSSKMAEMGLLNTDAVILAESNDAANLPEADKKFRIIQQKHYGITVVTIYQYEG